MPERQSLARGLISTLINQRFQEQSYEREREARQRERDVERQMELLQTAAQQGLNLDKLAALTPDVPTQYLGAFKELQRGVKQKQKEEETIKQVTDPQELQQLGAVGARRAGPTGALTPGDEAAYQGGLQQRAQTLGMLQRPELVTAMLQQVEQARAAQERNEQTTLAGEQRGELQNIRSEGRQNFKEKRRGLVASEAQRIAAVQEGMFQEDISPEAIARRLTTAGIPEQAAMSAAQEAIGLAAGERSGLKERREGAQGQRTDIQQAEDLKSSLIEDYPALADSPTLDRDVRMMVNRQAFIDPVLSRRGEPVFMRASSTKDYERQVARRMDLLDAEEGLKLMENAYAAAVEAKQQGKFSGGPLRTNSFFDALDVFGATPAEIAEMRTATTRYAFAQARATQGAKSSDMDMKYNLLYVPSPTEIGTASGNAKMEQAREIFEATVMAPVSPGMRKKLDAINARFRTPALDAAAAAASVEFKDNGFVSEATQRRLDAESKKFLESRQAVELRRALEDAGIVGGPGVPPDDAKLLEDF